MTAVAQDERRGTGRMKVHAVRGGGGLLLHVREWGKADGPPILFIHGWSQNHLCWVKQYESALADEFRLVAYDLRGHGMSAAPLEPEHYTDGKLWADDVAAILDELHLDRTVLVGWSYGAFVISDYIRAYGQDRIAAVNFVEGAVRLGEAAFGTLIGSGLPRPFRGGHRRRPTNQHLGHALLSQSVLGEASSSRRVRDRARLEHRRACADPCESRVPRDRLRRCARRVGGAVARDPGQGGRRRASGDGGARPGHVSDRRGVLVRGRGHTPHLEEPQRFNRELAELTRRVRA